MEAQAKKIENKYLTKEQLLNKVEELELENQKLKKSKKRKRRTNIKTTAREIVDYWSKIEDECGLSVDWAEAEERCWICGNKRKLQRCHIIPDSLGGKDEPANLVLLCERCHIDAPNVESATFMWDWIRANGTTFYDTSDILRAQKQYEFIYKKSFIQELMDRDILSERDFRRFFNVDIGGSSKHFAHPWKNDSTNAGLLRMRLEAYDKKYPNIKPKSESFRNKEKKFDSLVRRVCDIAENYNLNVWEGTTRNPFSITIGANLGRGKMKYVSIKLDRNNIFRTCFTDECNPNNLKVADYSKIIGESIDEACSFVQGVFNDFSNQYGLPNKQDAVFTKQTKICKY